MSDRKRNSVRIRRDIRDQVYAAAIEAWRNWLMTFAIGGRSLDAKAAILRQGNAMEMRSTTPGVYSNPTLSLLLAEERAWWSAAASIDAIICGLPLLQRQVVLGSVLGYSQGAIGDAVGRSQQATSDILAKAKEHIVTRLLLTASVVRWIAEEQGLSFAPPALSGIVGPCTV